LHSLLNTVLNSGQPKRHLLTTGWSVFVSAKRLVAGDSVLFIWYVHTSGIPNNHLSSPFVSYPLDNFFLVDFMSHCLVRNDNNQLLLGIRRANRPQTVMPSSVLSSDSMHIGLLAAAAHAASTNSRFTIFYNPRCTSNHLFFGRFSCKMF
jgi:hypothetical protein